jgi:RNA polymerase sigma factor (sigma-70 family)
VTSPDTIDCATLSRAIARGCEAAFAAFYAAWFAPALALAKCMSRRDEAFCLDVVQDVMLVVVHKLPPLADERAVRAWMTTTLSRAIADRQRAERRRQQRAAAAAAAASESGPEPWWELALGERQTWLQARLAELSPDDRALVAARFGDVGSVAAAGASFGLGADAAHGRLRRVLQRLRQQAAEWWHGHGK